MPRKDSFEERMQPILAEIKRREQIAKQELAGKNLVEDCRVFRLPVDQSEFKFDDPSTHNTKRGPDYLYRFVRQEGPVSLVIDDGGCGGGCKCHRKGEELVELPTAELVNSDDFLAAVLKAHETKLPDKS